MWLSTLFLASYFLFKNNFNTVMSCKSENITKNTCIPFSQMQLLLKIYPLFYQLLPPTLSLSPHAPIFPWTVTCTIAFYIAILQCVFSTVQLSTSINLKWAQYFYLIHCSFANLSSNVLCNIIFTIQYWIQSNMHLINFYSILLSVTFP